MKGYRKAHPLKWKDAKTILTFLEGVELYHHLIIMAVGFFTGFRASDILLLRYEDFQNQVLDLRKHKPTTQPPVSINPELQRIVQVCQVKLKSPDDGLLLTRNSNYPYLSISKALATRRIREAFLFAGFKNIQSVEQTVKKTFISRYLYLLQKAPGDKQVINELIALLKQSNAADMTLQYIRLIEPEIVQSVFDKFY